MEGVWVCDVVYEHDEVCFSEQFKSNLLEDVLASDVDAMQLHSFVLILLVKLHILHVVLAALGHHVLMVEMLVNSLVHEAGLSHCGLAGNHHSCAKNRHFKLLII